MFDLRFFQGRSYGGVNCFCLSRRLRRLFGNNSYYGSHLAALSVCRHLDEPIESYCTADHPAQKRLIEVIARLCDVSPSLHTVTDNCGMRSFALPLSALALGMTRLA